MYGLLLSFLSKQSFKIARVNRENYEVYPIIVRPNEYHDLEDDFITNELASRNWIT